VPHYRRVGDIPPKRHTVHRSPSGRLAEELMGEEGFSGASSLLYHRYSPSAILSAETVVIARDCPAPNDALRPLHFRLGTLGEEGNPVTGRRSLLANSDVTLCWVHATQSSELYRNAAGDEVVFVAEGEAVLESVFGRLEVGPGDYVVVPASTTHRWLLDGKGPVRMLVLEATGHITIPARYLTATGQLREGAPYSERDLRGPEGPLTAEGEQVPVLIRHRSGWARHVQACHPFDVVGWDGCVYPFAFSIKDFEPIVGRLHQPPPVHQTFAGPGFVVCSFVPRLLDFDPSAVRVPYHHANVDSDEVLFYVDGDFTSRSGAGIAPNSMTLHPAGFVHGPQPGSVEAAASAGRTDETAVMVDTFRPLGVTPAALGVSDDQYLHSWARPARHPGG
jgi:homogentisate 1,2-dioxygenase